jgi:hypothetical protein
MLLAIILKQLSTMKAVTTKKPRTTRIPRGLTRLTRENTPNLQLRPTLKSMEKNKIHIAKRKKSGQQVALFYLFPSESERIDLK